jgi:RNA polymerase sigma-70 factor (ECF subfamily)
LKSTQNPTDEALMAQVAAGERDALALLVNRHLKRAHALAQRITGKRMEAEDIAQEAFLRVWIHAGE